MSYTAAALGLLCGITYGNIYVKDVTISNAKIKNGGKTVEFYEDKTTFSYKCGEISDELSGLIKKLKMEAERVDNCAYNIGNDICAQGYRDAALKLESAKATMDMLMKDASAAELRAAAKQAKVEAMNEVKNILNSLHGGGK